MFRRDLNSKYYKRALNVLIGGINAEGTNIETPTSKPIYFKQAKGSKITSINNKSYLDLVNGWGANILGHASPVVLKALAMALTKVSSFGVNSKIEVEYAELLKKLVGQIESLRFVNSHTEASMLAFKLAKTYSGKRLILKLRGGYHGFHDKLIYKAKDAENESDGSKLEMMPESDCIYGDYNDSEGLKILFNEFGEDIAAVIIEPVASRMACVKVTSTFLKEISEFCTKNGSLLIMDDTTTGFRISMGGSVTDYGVQADLVLFGKIMGGGFPLSCVAGKTDILNLLLPGGRVTHSDETNCNPIILTTGYHTLKYMSQYKNFFTQLDEKTNLLVSGMKDVLTSLNIPVQVNYCNGMFSTLFCESKINGLKDFHSCNVNRYASFYKHMLKEGIILSPNPFDASYLSMSVSEREIRKVLRSMRRWKGR